MNKAQQPLVSIIIPVYNAEKYLEETINSAINQTWPNKEIIIIDDGSTDRSLKIAQSFNIKIIRIYQQKNKGASAARNKGLLEAKGTYIQFLDADDLLSANKINNQVKQLLGHTNTLSICPVIHFNENSEALEKLKPDSYELNFYKKSRAPYEFLLKLYGAENNQGSMIPIHSWLTPTNLINKAGKWNEALTINDDGEFFCRVVLQSKEILVTKQTVCYYRKHLINLSLSSGKDKRSVDSQHESILLKKKHLKSVNKNDKRVDYVTAKGLMELLMITYPEYKKLSGDILLEIKRSGVAIGAPLLGGKTIEIIKKIFGWKVARILQYSFSEVFRNNYLSSK
jgi:glycosyltransferase involved in cell wall biosynthesis